MQQSAQNGVKDESLHTPRAMIPWVSVLIPIRWISAVTPVPAMLVPLPLFGLPWLAMAIVIAVLSILPDNKDEFGGGLDHSGSRL